MINTGWLDQFSAGDASPLERAMADAARQDAREAAREQRLEHMMFFAQRAQQATGLAQRGTSDGVEGAAVRAAEALREHQAQRAA